MRPPFRADHVGSLLRPAALKKARADKSPQLGKIEDDCIREAVRMQEAAGLQAVTGGGLPRVFWQGGFLTGLGGIRATPGHLPANVPGQRRPSSSEHAVSGS